MNKFISSKIIPLSILFVVICFLILKKCNDRKNAIDNQNNCHKELTKEISGVIAKAYFDNDINRKAFVIEFTSKTNYVFPIYLKDLNGYVDEGDSIYKKAGTFKFVIFKKEYESPIIVEDTVNCDELN